MEFSLLEPPGGGLVEDELAPRGEARPRAEAVEVLPRDPPVEWYFEGLDPRVGPAAGPRAEEPAAGPRAEEEIEEPAARQNA